MPNLKSVLPAPVLLALGLWAAPPAAPTPVPGPGAVIQAIEGLVKAVDAGDQQALDKAFLPMHRAEGVQCELDPATGKLEYQEQGGDPDLAGIVFRDVGADGAPLQARTVAEASTLLREKVGGKESELSTRILAVRADCPGPHCSWASVTFERTFRRPDGQRVMVPMHATALVRYQSEAPTMRLFLWHASPTGPEQLLKK